MCTTVYNPALPAEGPALQAGSPLWFALVAVPIFNFIMAQFYIWPRTVLLLKSVKEVFTSSFAKEKRD